jgi:hypothetical protein
MLSPTSPAIDRVDRTRSANEDEIPRPPSSGVSVAPYFHVIPLTAAVIPAASQETITLVTLESSQTVNYPQQTGNYPQTGFWLVNVAGLDSECKRPPNDSNLVLRRFPATYLTLSRASAQRAELNHAKDGLQQMAGSG